MNIPCPNRRVVKHECFRGIVIAATAFVGNKVTCLLIWVSLCNLAGRISSKEEQSLNQQKAQLAFLKIKNKNNIKREILASPTAQCQVERNNIFAIFKKVLINISEGFLAVAINSYTLYNKHSLKG